MIEFHKTARTTAPNATASTKMYLFVDPSNRLCIKDNSGNVYAFLPENPYSAELTAGRAFTPADFGNLLRYNSAANADFTIPNDATLGITGDVNAVIEIYQMGTGRADIVAGAGVTLRVWAGYPAPTQYTSQAIHRVGPNTWAVK